MKIMHYQVVETGSPSAIRDEVDQLIAEGWQPYGDLNVTGFYEADEHIANWAYSQAMVLYEGPEQSAEAYNKPPLARKME